MGIKVFFVYAPPRVDCLKCGVRVEQMPWVAGKHQTTQAYSWFLAGWAKRLSWKDVAKAFRTTWGRAHQDLSGITAIGIDEIAWQRGHGI